MEQALLGAVRLNDGDLHAALRDAVDRRGDSFVLPVLQLPQDAGAALEPVGQDAQPVFMCPQLYRAAFNGAANELHRLLAENLHDGHPCSLEEVSAGSNTFLHIAAVQGHVDLVRRLFEDAPAAESAILLSLLARRNSKAETALHLAARAGHHEMVSLLIMLAQKDHGPGAARLLLLRSAGDTVLHVAARRGRHAVVERLLVVAPALSRGVNNARVSPLYLAVMSCSVDIVNALVDADATAPASGPNGQNALHAAFLKSPDITQVLLLRKLYLAREVDESGSTPLHYAASDGDPEIINRFIRLVPSSDLLYLKDKKGFTPLHIAAWMGHVGVIHDILQACPDSSEVTDMKGRNFLHVAIERGHESIIRYIVGSPFAGGLVNEQDNDGNTPLHLAVIAGKPRLAILESEFLELNIVNNEGRTPFDLVSDINSFLPMIGFVLKLSARGAWIGAKRQDLIPAWEGTMMKESIQKLSKNLGIVAVLIATIALSAMANVPGGYDSEGVPNLRGTRHYQTFVTLDTAAVACSMIATMLLIFGRGSSSMSSAAWICLALISLWFALVVMLLAFMTAMIPGLHNSPIIKRFIWSIFAFTFGSMVALSFVWAVPAPIITSVPLLFRARTGEDRVRMTRHIGRRFPQMGFYLWILYLFWFLNALAFAGTVHVIMITI